MESALTRQNRQLVATGPVGNLEGYLAAVHQIPVLEASEERDLAVRYRDEGDLDAARTLVISHLRFVVHIARGYKGYGLPLADLIQEGNIGLMKAVKRFDPEVGVRLISFAVHWVRAEIHEYILRNWRIVKVATTKAQRKLFFNLRKAKSRLGWFSKNEAEAVASDLGVEPKDVYEMESRLAGQDIRFDPAPESGDDEDAVYSPSAYLPDPNADPARAMEAEDWSDKGHDQLMEGFDRLDDRSRDILERRWMREDNRSTLQELATEYGVSAERIRQLEKNAMKKLRKNMTTH